MKAKKIFPNPPFTAVLPKPKFNRVMLVDDNETELFITETILKAISIAREIRLEEDPVSVLNYLQNIERLSEVPELIFLNINMRRMNGFDFLTEFNKLSDFVKNKCKIVAISDIHNNEPEKVMDADVKYRVMLNPGVVRFLVRPLDVYQLKDFITN